MKRNVPALAVIVGLLWLTACGGGEQTGAATRPAETATKGAQSAAGAEPDVSDAPQPAGPAPAEDAGGSSQSAAPEEEAGTSEADTAAAAQAAADLSQAMTLAGGPRMGQLTASPAAARPGDTITFSSEQAIDGKLRILGLMDEAGDFSGGASWTVPAEIRDGLYVAAVEQDGGLAAWTAFRVTSGEGVWLRADQSYSDGTTPTRLTVEAMDVPAGMTAALYLLDDGGSATTLVPDQEGRLAPGLPVGFEAFGPGAYTLPAGTAGVLEMRLLPDPYAQPVEGLPEFYSNQINLTVCDTPASVSGTLGSAGYVTAVWAGGGIHSRSLYTTDGAFQFEVPAGLVMIQAISQSGGVSREMVSLGCGEQATASAVGAALSAGGSLPAAKDRRLFTLGPSRQAAADRAQSGGSQICRTTLIDASVSIGGEKDDELAVLAAAALREAASQAAPQASYVTYADVRAFLEEAAALMVAGDDEAAQAAIEAASDALAVDTLITLQAVKFGETFAVAAAALPMHDEDAQVRGSGTAAGADLGSAGLGVYQQFAESFSHSAICGQVTPEEKQITPGETVALTYSVTDLAGEPADGAEVTVSEPTCGQLEPQGGSAEGGEFQTSYQFPQEDVCVEQLAFEAKWVGPAGSLETLPRESIAHLYPVPISMKLYAGSVPGISPIANLVGAASSGFPDWDIKEAPGELPAIQPSGACGYLEGGTELTDQFWYVRSSFEGSNSEGAVSVFSGDPSPEDPTPAPRQLRFATKSSAFPVMDDGQARGTGGYAGNYSDLLGTGQFSSAVFLFDIENPGELPNWHPAFVWQSQISSDGGSYEAFMFYKIINCETDAGLGGMESFFSTNTEFLMAFADDEPGETAGNSILPPLEGARTQILLYVMTVSSSGSILDSADNLYASGIAKMQIDLQLYFAQELTGE